MQVFHLESVQVIHAADWAICYIPIGSHYPIFPPKFSHIHVSYIYTIHYNAVLYYGNVFQWYTQIIPKVFKHTIH